MPDRDDSASSEEPASSEELIRRARDELQGESSIEEPLGDHDPIEEPLGDHGPIEREERGEKERTTYRTSPPYAAHPPATSGPLENDQRTTSRGSLKRFLGWFVISVVVLAVIFIALSAFDGKKPVQDLGVGDCINDPGETVIESITTVACDDPHDYEVFQVIEVPHGEFSEYPGDELLFQEVFDICVGHFAAFVGIDYVNSIYYVNATYPTKESWDEMDDREAACLIMEHDATNNIIQVEGTLRNRQK